MKLPRISCPTCGRPIAAGPVAGRLGRGRLRRHDEPGMREDFAGVLVSCSGSRAVVDLPADGDLQLELGADESGHVDDEDALPLF
ncbi:MULTISPECIES: hypothetical protein [unclassified Streptomyces]|uniref:hypothetical protein n=1 Tax=unclassified Streptomyces TaxID=2593676 RepID=UPI0003773FC9|nr:MULTISPECIES: hypothetical protein [unclassified Streptomyces]MYX39045.1 hypothetical protein [Streptomyces sp. SID8377]